MKLRILIFAIAAVFAIAMSSGLQSANAETPIQTTRYKDSQIEHYFGGKIVQTLGMQEYVWDGAKWVDREIQNNGTHFNVNSALGSFSFNKSTCTITQYKKGFDPIGRIAHDSDIVIRDWFWTIARQNGASWQVVDATIFGCNITTFSNSTGKYLEMTRTHAPTGSYLKVTLAAPKDQPVEDFAEFYMNVPAWNGNKFAFVLWSKGVQADQITYRNGTTITIPQGATTIDRSQLTVDSLNFIKEDNAFSVDWMKAKDQFKTLLLNKTGGNLDVQFGFNNNAPTLTTGQKIFLDPTYGYTAATNDRYVRSASQAAAICGAPASTNTSDYQLQIPDQTNNICILAAFQWNTSTIPNNAQIVDVDLRFDINGGVNRGNCDFTEMVININTANASAVWSDITNGTIYVSNNALCTTTALDKLLDLGDTAVTHAQSTITGDDLFTLGFKPVTLTRDASDHTWTWAASAANAFELQITYAGVPWAVTDLTYTDLTDVTIDLDWTQPSLQNGTLSCYQVNYTSPYGLPQTVLSNCTGSTVSAYDVSGLARATQYSFRVAAWTNIGTNASGNILNVTTLPFVPANFTIGFLDANVTNPDITPIRFVRSNINDTAIRLQVIYDEDYIMNCNFDFEFAGTNKSYNSLTPTVYDADHEYTNFTFINMQSELIKARCWDIPSNTTGRYVITQSVFPLLEQIANFRNGTYGTMGMFGAFDLITLAIMFFSTIGFNRINEAVGAFINVSLLGALSYFGIITLPTLIFGAIAVVMMTMIMHTRKD